MQNGFGGAATAIRDFFQALYDLRIPLVICLLLFLLYDAPQLHQLTEVQTVRTNPLLFALTWATSLLYLVAFAYVMLPPKASSVEDARPSLWFARLLFVSAVGSSALIFNAIMWTAAFRGYAQIAAACAALAVGAVILWWLTAALTAASSRLVSFAGIRLVGTLLGVLGFAAVTLAMLYVPVEFPRSVGTFSIIYIF